MFSGKKEIRKRFKQVPAVAPKVAAIVNLLCKLNLPKKSTGLKKKMHFRLINKLLTYDNEKIIEVKTVYSKDE